MADVSATEAARNFSELLDSVERDGADFTVIRRGRAIARIGPVRPRSGAALKDALREVGPDTRWAGQLEQVRSLLETDHGW